MKRLIYILLIVSGAAYGQNTEFQVFSNGLIYDDQTMNRLGVIVDSLNVRFRTCDLSHPYFSYPQGMATLVEVPNKTARKLILSGVSLDEYKSRFPGKINKEQLWITKSSYKTDDGDRFLIYEALPHGGGNRPSMHVKYNKANDKNSGWVVEKDSDIAYYLTDLKQYELPYAYARLVQYVDCMIDTTASIFFPKAEEAIYKEVTPGSKAFQFVEWIERFPGRPAYPDYDKIDNYDSAIEIYITKQRSWDSLRMMHIDQELSSSVYWKSLLMEANEESLLTGISDERLEYYVARYISKEDALQLMRNRRVIGYCSQDLSPRYHAVNICKLAAETTKWDIFLRSHLDIMNDRFERMSDGSYAWAGRKTYLKELEELDIDAVDLLVGTCLRVENVSDNHYFGSIGRVGRALADASDKGALEDRLVAMVGDENLDPFNRLLSAYLFSNYVYNLDTEEAKNHANEKLSKAVATFPTFLREVWNKD